MAGPTGAEWSLFCPGIGIALDSWLGVSTAFVRPAVGSALGPALGLKTELASGTDVPRPLALAGAVSACGVVVIGAAGNDGPLLQAIIASAAKSRAPPCVARRNDFRSNAARSGSPPRRASEGRWTVPEAAGFIAFVPVEGLPNPHWFAAMGRSSVAPTCRRTGSRQTLRRASAGPQSQRLVFGTGLLPFTPTPESVGNSGLGAAPNRPMQGAKERLDASLDCRLEWKEA